MPYRTEKNRTTQEGSRGADIAKKPFDAASVLVKLGGFNR